MSYTESMHFIILLLATGCGQDKTPEYCLNRSMDPDCDGIELMFDQCGGSDFGVRTDARGCSERQTTSCTVDLQSPYNNEKLTAGLSTVFRWEGNCEVYLLQFSEDQNFHPASTRTAGRYSELQGEVIADETYWRVVGGMTGESTGVSTTGRLIKWD